MSCDRMTTGLRAGVVCGWCCTALVNKISRCRRHCGGSGAGAAPARQVIGIRYASSMGAAGMNRWHRTISFCCLYLAGCAAQSGNDTAPAAASDVETVLITYQVIPGKEQELRQVLSD